jgi:hypothetical protein
MRSAVFQAHRCDVITGLPTLRMNQTHGVPVGHLRSLAHSLLLKGNGMQAGIARWTPRQLSDDSISLNWSGIAAIFSQKMRGAYLIVQKQKQRRMCKK